MEEWAVSNNDGNSRISRGRWCGSIEFPLLVKFSVLAGSSVN